MKKDVINKYSKTEIHKFAISSMRKYGAEVIENRALADYRDGLKPVQRRLLWTMQTSSPRISSNGRYVKSARVVGECFAAGTMVSVPGGVKAIENFEIGDQVITSHGVRTVTKVFENPPSPMYDLLLKDGKRVVLTKEQEVKIMIGDKFFWKKACDLDENDIIVVEP